MSPATPGWRQVFSRHYGPAGDYSSFAPAVAFAADGAAELKTGSNAAIWAYGSV
jgi:hypothetical protein